MSKKDKKKKGSRLDYQIAMPPKDDLAFQRLGGCGADVTQLALVKPFCLEETVKQFTSGGKGLTPRRVDVKEQMSDFEKVMLNPLAVPYTYCISGQASDLRAKMVAAKIVLRALEIDPECYHNIWWHHLTGSYKDKLRDYNFPSHKKPKLIVLCNFPLSTEKDEHATQQKIEKCRDILEMYSDVPRIVVSCGLDPVQIFTKKLMYSLNFKLNIPSSRHIGFE